MVGASRTTSWISPYRSSRESCSVTPTSWATASTTTISRSCTPSPMLPCRGRAPIRARTTTRRRSGYDDGDRASGPGPVALLGSPRPRRLGRSIRDMVGLVPEPKADRPYIPDYGIPTSSEGTLPYDHVSDRLASARNYWVSTARPDGRPHAVPTWGVWLDGAIYFGGGTGTRKARNLKSNPNVVVHTESGDEVVIVEGQAEPVTDEEEQHAWTMRMRRSTT